MEYPAESIKRVVEELSKIPGVGKKTALRHTLHLLRSPIEDVKALGEALLELKEKTILCKTCYNISDFEICNICANTSRNASVICVVADIRDLMAIEKTSQYNGKYHVLGGLIDPLRGINVNQLKIDELIERVKNEGTQEIILALNATAEGETTAFYIARKLQSLPVRITSIARGIPVGTDLEYAYYITISRSLSQRIDYINPLTTQQNI